MPDRRQSEDRRKEDRRKCDRRETKETMGPIIISFKAFVIIIITVVVLAVAGLGIVKYLYDKQEKEIQSLYEQYYVDVYEDEEYSEDEMVDEEDYEQYEENIEI